jgi:hypothetical protein
MRQTAARLSSWLTAPSRSPFGALIRRLALVGLLLAALTLLASIALVS